VCRHEEREAIHEAMIGGQTVRAIAAKWQLSKSAVARHQEHAAALLQAGKSGRAGLEAGALVVRVEELHQAAREILEEARADGDDKTALRAIARLERQVALAARLLGEIQGGVELRLVDIPEWSEMKGRLLRALEGHPKARGAVILALEGR
jgi:hypothetical protein